MTTPETPTSVSGIVNLLERASNAYYNGGQSIMDDESYDFLVEKLRQAEPDHPFLKTVGAASADAVELPYTMASLDKIKPGQGVLGRFLSKHATTGFILSEKLDGLSALWCPAKRALYLRGDGLRGPAISQFANYIRGLKVIPQSAAIRGELILPRENAAGARATLNGLLHQKGASKEQLGRVRFIAYEVIRPDRLTRKEQMEWLEATGFETPWWKAVASLSEEDCSEAFLERRSSSAYDTDGIVVGANTVPVRYADVQNPKDCVAFKMAADDQSATTTVREILWATAAQGYIIPRIRFDPVLIGGATIEFCSGHNARNIVDKGLGPGAQVKIRRSGDVIPTLDMVLIPAETAGMPADTSTWTWAPAPSPHIISTGTVTPEQTTSQLLHFAKTHDIPGLGPANCKLLVKAGITGPATLWSATAAKLKEVLGPKTGETIHAGLRTTLAKTTELALMLSSSAIPRGVGETKLKALFAVYPDPRDWSRITTVEAWTGAALQEFLAEFNKYEAWRRAEIPWIPYPIVAAAAPAAVPSRTLCFTGFRDKDLETLAAANHFTIVPAVTQTLAVLVIPDDVTTPSEKVKKATKYGTEILSRTEFTKKYISTTR